MTESAPFLPEFSSAIRSDDDTRLATILQQYPDQLTIITPFNGGTWLHFACYKGATNCVKALLSYGADINSRALRDGRHPLSDAASSGNAELVLFLMDSGAKIDTSSPEGNPLFSAITSGSRPIVELLLNRGADASVRYSGPNMKNMDALAFALESGESDIAQILADHLSNGHSGAGRQLMLDGQAVVKLNNADL